MFPNVGPELDSIVLINQLVIVIVLIDLNKRSTLIDCLVRSTEHTMSHVSDVSVSMTGTRYWR